MDEQELLKYLVSSGKVDLQQIYDEFEMSKRKEYLSKHKYKIWQGKDGIWYTRILDKTKGNVKRLVRRKTKRALEDLLIDYYIDLEANPTIFEIFTLWNKRRLDFKEISPRSFDRIESTYNRHFSEFGKRKIRSITTKDVIDFLRFENMDKNLCSKSYSLLKSIIKGIIEYSLENDYITENEYIKFHTRLDHLKLKHSKKVKDEEDEIFTDEEAIKLFNYLVKNIENRRNLGLLLMMVTGIRVGELAALKYEDFTVNTIKIRRTETNRRSEETNRRGQKKTLYYVKDYPKTKDSVRTIVVPNNFLFIIQTILKNKELSKSEYAFTDEKDNRLTVPAFDSRLRTACKNCGFAKIKSCHKFRKTYISILLDNNIDSNLIRQQVGHLDISTSEKFYHRNRKSIDKKSEILSSVPDFSIFRVV